GSRSDIDSLLVLRPLSAVFLVYAVSCMAPAGYRAVRVLILILCALIANGLFQLVPLPTLFSAHDGNVEQMKKALGLLDLDRHWRPISLDPNRTWNTIFALIVPLATVCLYAIQRDRFREVPLLALLGVALLSAGVACVQAVGGDV